MNPETRNWPDPASSYMQSEDRAGETLRLLAELPPPAGLNDRVHRRLASARASSEPRSLLASIWRLWMPTRRLQFAAAGVLVVAIGASSWSVYHSRSRVQPGVVSRESAAAGTTPTTAPKAGQSGFGSASAKGHPSTLAPIKVPAASKKKPSASHGSKPSPKVLAVKPASTDPAAKGPSQ